MITKEVRYRCSVCHHAYDTKKEASAHFCQCREWLRTPMPAYPGWPNGYERQTPCQHPHGHAGAHSFLHAEPGDK